MGNKNGQQGDSWGADFIRQGKTCIRAQNWPHPQKAEMVGVTDIITDQKIIVRLDDYQNNCKL